MPGAPQTVGGEPPKIVEKMRTGKLGNAVPGDFGEIKVLDILAVDMNFVGRGELRNPFGDAPLGAVAFVNERRDDRETRLANCVCHSSDSYLHRLAPGREDEDAPEPRPADRFRITKITLPQVIHRRRLQHTGRGEAVRREDGADGFAQVVAQPAREGKREGALGTVLQLREKSRRKN